MRAYQDPMSPRSNVPGSSRGIATPCSHWTELGFTCTWRREREERINTRNLLYRRVRWEGKSVSKAFLHLTICHFLIVLNNCVIIPKYFSLSNRTHNYILIEMCKLIIRICKYIIMWRYGNWNSKDGSAIYTCDMFPLCPRILCSNWLLSSTWTGKMSSMEPVIRQHIHQQTQAIGQWDCLPPLYKPTPNTSSGFPLSEWLDMGRLITLPPCLNAELQEE